MIKIRALVWFCVIAGVLGIVLGLLLVAGNPSHDTPREADLRQISGELEQSLEIASWAHWSIGARIDYRQFDLRLRGHDGLYRVPARSLGGVDLDANIGRNIDLQVDALGVTPMRVFGLRIENADAPPSAPSFEALVRHHRSVNDGLRRIGGVLVICGALSLVLAKLLRIFARESSLAQR